MSNASGRLNDLDRIEQLARERQFAVLAAGGDQRAAAWAAIAIGSGNVLALVNIARAAQDYAAFVPGMELSSGRDARERLRAALSAVGDKEHRT